MDRTDSRLAHSPGPASDDAASSFNSPDRERQDLLDFEPVPLRQRRDGLTPEKQREYVEALADCGVVREAAARVGISEQAISRVRRRADARDFDRACEAAHMFGARHLRSIAFERAIEGTLKGHYYHGELVGQERVYDNRLLTYLLGKTGHLLEPSEESRAICDDWEGHMDALEQGLPLPAPGRAEALPPLSAPEEAPAPDDDDPQVWCEDGIWWTYFPPPEDFDGEEEGEIGDRDYRRTLTDEEEAVMETRNEALDEAEMARCCDLRDRYFGLPPRGCDGYFRSQGSRNNETSEPDRERDGEDRGEGPIEYKSLFPPYPSPCRGEGQPPRSGGRVRAWRESETSPHPPASRAPPSPLQGEGFRAYRPRRFRSIPEAARLWGKHG